MSKPRKPRVSKIDPAVLRQMWADGYSTSAIAERFGVQYPAINKAAERLELPKRDRPSKTVADLRAAEAVPDRAPAGPATYSEMAEEARRRGVPLILIHQEFHRARAAARSGGRHDRR